MQKWQEHYKDSDVFIMHGKNGECRFTLAVVPSEYGDDIGIGLATCDPRDQFSRKVGREIATGRAKRAMADANYGARHRTKCVAIGQLAEEFTAFVATAPFTDDALAWMRSFVSPHIFDQAEAGTTATI